MRKDLGTWWLVLASLFFYGWWNPVYLWFIGLSMAFNFSLARRFEALRASGSVRGLRSLLTLGVGANLGFLGWFKYADFFIENVNALAATSVPLLGIVLPLAISFFTFQQIAYLVDAYRGETQEHSALHYCLFVCFFPQLIAGPIVHHKEILDQFEARQDSRLHPSHLAVGGTLFFLGLFKKTVLADGVAQLVGPVFDAARDGVVLSLYEAWQGTLAYTLQIYFDFSGYSDMAIGLGFLFGVRLPLNFHSPYKATSIVEFWRRWHITLSRFLRDYLYIGLGGNRRGKARRYLNLLLTMVLGGLWHGAAWTFVIWGALHGLYLVLNHAWAGLQKRLGVDLLPGPVGRVGAVAMTFLAVVISWVFFRAEGVSTAWSMLRSMSGHADLAAYANNLLPSGHAGFFGIAALLAVVFFAPNSHQLLGEHQPALEDHLTAQDGGRAWGPRWSPRPAWAGVMAAVAVVAVMFISRQSEFLYFRF